MDLKAEVNNRQAIYTHDNGESRLNWGFHMDNNDQMLDPTKKKITVSGKPVRNHNNLHFSSSFPTG